VTDGGIAVLPRDDLYFDRLKARADSASVARILTFGRHESADVRLIDADITDEGSWVTASVAGRRLSYRLGAQGAHWVSNSLAVLATVRALDLDVETAAGALADLGALPGRGARHTIPVDGGDALLIDESYNANPTSVKAALAVLANAKGGGRRIAVFGDMLELGADAEAAHAGLAPAVLEADVDLVFTCGPLMERLHNALPAARRGPHEPDSKALAPHVTDALKPGDRVLVKGSLGSRMAAVITALKSLAERRRPDAL
jgi:UDP-N-acetylmuramoyl-tripeptide--D-alanyl-D-alanine ligase